MVECTTTGIDCLLLLDLIIIVELLMMNDVLASYERTSPSRFL